MTRMFHEEFYNKLAERNKYLIANNFEKAKALAKWKDRIKDEWDNIDVINYSFEKTKDNIYKAGHEYTAEVALSIKNIPQENVGVESVLATFNKNGEYQYISKDEFKLVSSEGDKCYYSATLVPEKAGSFYYGIRIYPKHKDLPHRQDFYLLRWID